MLTMYQQITIQTLAKQGKKKTEIAREMGCHRNTVRNIILVGSAREKQTRVKHSYFAPYHDQIKTWVDKDVSALRMYELLIETHHMTRTYDSLCKYIQKEFPKTPEAYGVQVTSPGEEAEVDFGYAGLQPVNAPGTPVTRGKTWVLCVTLSHSRASYHETTGDQKVTTLTAGITHAFTSFGGVPKRLKVDNLRAAILTNQHFDLQFNQDFLEWANHYGCVIVPCTPYHPEQKGKVESDVKYVKGNFFVERTFSDAQDMHRQLSVWTREYANERIHGTTKTIPWDVLMTVERPCLQRIPETPHTTFERGTRTVAGNCHIFFGNNYYSVPSVFVGKTVTIRWSRSILRIVVDGEEITSHTIISGAGQYVTRRSHLPQFKHYGQTEYQKKYEDRMADIGEFAHQYFQEVLVGKQAYWFQNVRSIIGLAHHYGNEAVNLALKRALRYMVVDIGTIRNILEQRLYTLECAPRLLTVASLLPSTDDASSEVSRDLSYYQQLLNL
ncbi:MAG: IS21 family transposase [Patescibacteria group bacterium]